MQNNRQGRISAPISLNAYLYADADPVNGSDPSGRETLPGLAVANNSAFNTGVSISINLTTRTFVKRLFIAAGLTYLGASAVSMVAGMSERELQREREAVRERVLSRSRNGRVVFHYTNPGAATAIMGTRIMLSSPAFNGISARGCPKPPGAFASTIPPWHPTMTQAELSAIFYGGNPSRDVSFFVAIDDSDEEFRPIRCAPAEVFKPWMFPGEVPVNPIIIGPNLMRPY